MAPPEDVPMKDIDPKDLPDVSEDDSDSASEDDSDSASDSDDGDEDVAMPDESAMDKIMKLERRLESDPGDYAAHVQLCASLREWPSLRRRLGDAREAFATRFPLNETQWREWISDEVRWTKGRRKRRGKVVGALFERAVTDYQSVALWLGYAEFSLDQGWDTETRRRLYERALELAGLHFTDGHKIWAAYRAFELSKLELDAKENPNSAPAQEETVRALLRRQLAVPHAQADETMGACERWEASRPAPQTLDASAAASFAKARAEAAARQPLERAVAAAETKGEPGAIGKAHRAYIDFEVAAGVDATRVRAAYERAVKSTPTDPHLWRRYTDYLDYTVKVHVLSAAAHERACRNCPRHGETWAAWIRYRIKHRMGELGLADAKKSVEDDGAEFKKVEKIYEECSEIMNKGIMSGPDTGDDMFAIFLPLIHLVKHCCSSLLGGESHVVVKARETLAEFFPGWVDMRLPKLYADISADEVHEIWESFVKPGVLGSADGEALWGMVRPGQEGIKGGEYANVAEAWIAHAAHSDNPREVFKTCYARTNLTSTHGRESGQAVLCRAWLQYELDEGDPLTYAAADAKAGAILRRLELEERERKLLDPTEAKRLRRANDPNYKGPGDGKNKRKAGDDDSDEDDEDGGGKRAKTADADGEEKDKERQGLGTDPAERAAKYKEIFPDRDQRTAFVKNLPFKCTEDELSAWFDARGGSVTARIVRDKASGRSRGFAYVEFTEEGAVQAAIMRDGEEFQGRALSIARSLPPGEKRSEGGGERRERTETKPRRGPAKGLGFSASGGMKPRAVGGGMMPRAAGRPTTTAAKPADAAPKSNADFKAMFFKKAEDPEGK